MLLAAVLFTSCATASLSKYRGVGRIKQYDFYSYDVPSAFDGFRIGFASDFHYESRFTRKRLDNAISAKSILGKLQKKDLDLTLSAACNNIYDIAGIRVVCSYIKDVYLIRDRLMAQDDVMIMQIKDYIETPKENGYRSLHMVIRVPVYFMNKKQLVPVELQIRTLAMDLWASLEHDIKYKCLYQAETEDFSEELKECSRLIYEAEEKMEIMNRTLEA